jgi:Glutaredoxin-like domain (DUF836)
VARNRFAPTGVCGAWSPHLPVAAYFVPAAGQMAALTYNPGAMSATPLPDLILYGRPGCGLCDETRALLEALLRQRSVDGRPTPRLLERDIDADPDLQRAFFAVIPVVELGDRRVELATSLPALRRLLTVLDVEPVDA